MTKTRTGAGGEYPSDDETTPGNEKGVAGCDSVAPGGSVAPKEAKPQSSEIKTETSFDIIQQLLAGMQSLTAKPTVDLPTFSGGLLEDPTRFLDALADLSPQDTPTDRLLAAEKQLRGDAAAWWNAFTEVDRTYEDLKRMLLDKYDDIQVQAQLSAQYYGLKQTSREAVKDFLQMKAKLAKRLNLQPQDHISLFIGMMLPEVRPLLRQPQPRTMLELIARAMTAEEDVREQAAAKKALPTPRPKQAEASTPLERRPPRCHFCPEFHFHRDCPIFTRRNPTPGNDQPTADASSSTAGRPRLQ